MQTLVDLLIFSAVMFVLLLLPGIGAGGSLRNPLTWIAILAAAYVEHLIYRKIFSAKPRWKREEDQR